MHDSELYRKYRQLIEGLADERRSTELSLTTLQALLRQFESEAGALEPAAAAFVSTQLPTNSNMKPSAPPAGIGGIVLLAAVKGFDGMPFAGVKT